ncbi:DUF6745 domain-containing protein [Actinomadura sp. DC4]|uniref:DUF6745 domain-containing protein n=1 Tax=Actinomadura sp. DC4 TaxID=3055069 RepID=UPI0025AF0A2E|nr:hypothetical protein [Actinomadura sp. DC4]MDN3352055.1 hypothetical protein [Actinomadura sp. DC4]
MIAPARRDDAAVVTVRGRSTHERWQEASKIRQEWLDHGLSTQPADRRTAERNLTAVYARISRPRPRFVWVSSPREALGLVAGLPTLDQLYGWVRDPRPRGKPPLASDLALLISRLRAELSAGVSHPDPELSSARKSKELRAELPPLRALEAGVPLGVVLHQGIRVALHRSLAAGFRGPVLAALAGNEPVPVCWYGQQDASWVGYYDALHRLGLATYGPDAFDHLGHWAALARSCGWWWPGEDVCVVTERPESAGTEPVRGTWHDEVRLNEVRYRDGWHPRLT